MFFLFLFYSYLKFFSKKLIVLLILEGFMLTCIIIFQVSYSFNLFSFLMMMIFSVFMVLDSVFGVCLLISSSRNFMVSMKTL